MKPAPFEYYAPDTLDEALTLLGEHGYDAKLLAGGQSLIPMMNFRLVQPAILVDLNRIPELAYIQSSENGSMLLGAMTRHRQVEHDLLVAEKLPIIHETMPYIATTQIRSRGTFGGSIAHADPSAELAAVSVALEGSFRLQSINNERWIPARDFFIGMFSTVLEPDEILVEILFPPVPKRTGYAIYEVARRLHDFAIVGVAATITLDSHDRCKKARLVYFSVGEGPVEAVEAEKLLEEHKVTPELIQSVVETAATKDTEPSSDIHATSEFRKHLVKVLGNRVLQKAYERALAA